MVEASAIPAETIGYNMNSGLFFLSMIEAPSTPAEISNSDDWKSKPPNKRLKRSKWWFIVKKAPQARRKIGYFGASHDLGVCFYGEFPPLLLTDLKQGGEFSIEIGLIAKIRKIKGNRLQYLSSGRLLSSQLPVTRWMSRRPAKIEIQSGNHPLRVVLDVLGTV